MEGIPGVQHRLAQLHPPAFAREIESDIDAGHL